MAGGWLHAAFAGGEHGDGFLVGVVDVFHHSVVVFHAEDVACYACLDEVVEVLVAAGGAVGLLGLGDGVATYAFAVGVGL